MVLKLVVPMSAASTIIGRRGEALPRAKHSREGVWDT